MDTLPYLAADLVRQLDELLPPACIRQGESLEDAHRRAGKRDLIDFLVSLLEEAGDQSPDTPLLR